MKSHRLKNSIKGFTITEVLVSMFVLSVGMLGLAGLQGSALRNTYSATLKTEATLLGGEILESMRTNRSTARLTTSGNPYKLAFEAAIPSSPPKNCATSDTECTAVELAAHDVYHWLQKIKGTGSKFPSGDAAINLANINNGEVTISIRWDNLHSTGNTIQYDVSTML